MRIRISFENAEIEIGGSDNRHPAALAFAAAAAPFVMDWLGKRGFKWSSSPPETPPSSAADTPADPDAGDESRHVVDGAAAPANGTAAAEL